MHNYPKLFQCIFDLGCETTIKELEAKFLLTVACMLFVLRFPKK